VTVELIWVRHGESGWNTAGLIQGQSPDAPGLTETGRRQAAAAASELESSAPSRLYVSDLWRAIETAMPIAVATGLIPRVDRRLRERRLGIAEATPSVARPDLGTSTTHVVDPDARPEGGESIRELYDRVAMLIDDLRRPVVTGTGGTEGPVATGGPRTAGGPGTTGGPIVLVTHGGVVRAALAYLDGLQPSQMSWTDIANASITRTVLD